MTKKARDHQNLLSQLTQQWKREYLTGLREQSILKQKNCSRDISVGDIVLLKKDSTSRCMWKLAKVEELLLGTGGKVRSAIVKVSNNDSQPIHRVVQHLIPIEVKANEEEDGRRQSTDDPVTLIVADNEQRPRHNAAVIGEMVRRANDS